MPHPYDDHSLLLCDLLTMVMGAFVCLILFFRCVCMLNEVVRIVILLKLVLFWLTFIKGV